MQISIRTVRFFSQDKVNKYFAVAKAERCIKKLLKIHLHARLNANEHGAGNPLKVLEEKQ